MRRIIFLSLILAFLPLLAVASDIELSKIAAEVRLGDLAMEKGDFDNAVDYYSSALDRNGADRKLRGDIILKLARARLHSGDPVKAVTLMREFQRDYPERSTGLLPGEILQKTGKNEQAGSFFSNLLKSSADDMARSEILYRLAEVAIAEGDYQRAEDCLNDIINSGNELWAAQAKLTKIFVLIRKGEFLAAAQELDSFDANGKIPPGGEFRSKSLRLLLMAQIGDVEKFMSLWAEFSHLYAPEGNQLVAEALGEVAQRLVKAGKSEDAESLLIDAFAWQQLDSERQDLMRTLFSVQTGASGNAERAAATAERYFELFPRAEDRIDMLFAAAGKLYSADKLEPALDLFLRVSNEPETPKKMAMNSRRNAVLIAEKLEKFDLAKNIYRELISLSTDAEAKNDKINFGAFLFRIGEYDESIKLLEKISGDDRAAMLLTDAAIRAGKLTKARDIATELSRSKDPESAGFGIFHLAELAEAEGDLPGARTIYLQYVKRFGNDGYYSDKAGFCAALLAWKSGNDDKALELKEFARLNPESKNAPLALFVAMQTASDLAEAHQIFALLREKYPDSPRLKHAVLYLAGCLIQSGDKEKFFTLLDENEKSFSEVNELAELGFVRLRGVYAFNGAEAASVLGNELKEKYPSADMAPEIAFFCGNIEAELKQYEKARESYRRAAELCPAGRLYCCARGREADMDVALFVSGVDAAALGEAEAIYQIILDRSHSFYTDIELESIFKLGHCRELAGKKMQALKIYEQVLYTAGDMRKRGIAPKEVWVVQAVCRAVRILTEIRPSGYISRALRDINLVKELNLKNTGEDFDRMSEELREMFKSAKK